MFGFFHIGVLPFFDQRFGTFDHRNENLGRACTSWSVGLGLYSSVLPRSD